MNITSSDCMPVLCKKIQPKLTKSRSAGRQRKIASLYGFIEERALDKVGYITRYTCKLRR